MWVALLSIGMVGLVWLFEYMRKRGDDSVSVVTQKTVERRRMSHSRQRSFDDMASISIRGHDSPQIGRTPNKPGHRRRHTSNLVSAPLRAFSAPEEEPLIVPEPDLNAAVVETKSVEIEFRNVTLTLRKDKSKRILHNVSGSMYPENVSVIMGPSGAGKTSLLSVLLGKAQDYATVDGSVLLNHVGLRLCCRLPPH